MEVKRGYRHTEAGIIPVDWAVTPLNQISNLDVGFAFKSSSFKQTGGVRLLRGENVGYGRLDWTDSRTIQQNEAYGFNQYLLHAGSIVIGMDRTFTKSGTKISRVVNSDCPCLLVQRVGRFIPKLCTKNFLWALLCSSRYQSLLQVEQKGMDIPHLSRDEILSPTVAFPPTLAEQEAIAGALSDADAWIESLKQLIAKKRQIKQGAMQELLTCNRRLPGFSGEWERFRFDQLFTNLRNASNSRSELSTQGDVAYVHYGDIHIHSNPYLNPFSLATFIPRDKVRSTPRLEDGDLLLADASEDTAAIGKAVEIVELGSREAVAGLHTMALRGNKERLANGYKGYIQFLPEVRAGLISLATGVSVFGITKSGVKAIEVKIPKPDEQSAIAEALSMMENETIELESKHSKARQIKQAMMQELLTGRIRLVKPTASSVSMQEAVHA